MGLQLIRSKQRLSPVVRQGNIAANRRLYRQIGLSLRFSFAAWVVLWSLVLLLLLWGVKGVVSWSHLSAPVQALVWVGSLVVMLRVSSLVFSPLRSYLPGAIRALVGAALLLFLAWNAELIVSFLFGSGWIEGLRRLI